jgi:hypothetical protein
MTTEETRKQHDRIGKAWVRIVDRDLLVFLFFLALSFVFWYLNGLSKEVESIIKYPVRYVNPPKDRLLIGSLPPRLDFSVRGPGYSVLKLKLSGSRAPVVVDMSKLNYIIKPESRSYNYYVLTAGLKDGFHKQLRADFEILRILPDTLSFSFDLVSSKMVPVRPDVEVITDKEFFVRGMIEAVPDSVEISGPRAVIDTIDYVLTKHRRFTGVNQSFQKNLHIAGSRDYSVSAKRAIVKVNVEQFTEARLELPVRIINKPDSVEIRLFPDMVNVHLLVAISDYKGIFESNISAIIDYALAFKDGSDKLSVVITNVPSYANTVRYSPQELDYIIEKRDK